MVADNIKYCCYCKRDLPLSMFHNDRSRPDGLCRRCKECNTKHSTEYMKKHRDRRRKYELKHFYGLTIAQYESLGITQKCVCAICGTRPEKHLSVDHDHATGKVRGLLCRPCNSAIGLLKDDPHVCFSAALYLKKRKAKHGYERH